MKKAHMSLPQNCNHRWYRHIKMALHGSLKIANNSLLTWKYYVCDQKLSWKRQKKNYIIWGSNADLSKSDDMIQVNQMI